MESLEDRRLLALSAELVADLVPSGVSSSPHAFTAWNDLLYFQVLEGFASIFSRLRRAQIRDGVPKDFPLSNISHMYAVDQTLYLVGSAYDDLDDPANLYAVEVRWAAGRAGGILSERDLRTDFRALEPDRIRRRDLLAGHG